MTRLILPLLVLCAAPLAAQSAHPSPDPNWLLDTSTLTYKMTHPVHEIEGTTHAARGKGFCRDGQCDFLLAAPVKTFDSGDTNRDLHMLQVVRGAQYPIVSVRFRIPEADTTQPDFTADLEVTFAGQTAHYAHVPFHQDIQGAEHHITGTVPSTIADFKIPPPTFLTVPIHNEIPVRVDTTWHAQ